MIAMVAAKTNIETKLTGFCNMSSGGRQRGTDRQPMRGTARHEQCWQLTVVRILV